MLFENETIRLRALEPEDLDNLYRWENDSTLWIHGNSLSPYSKLAIREYISNSIENDIFQTKQLRLMVELKDGNQTIGTIDLYDLDMRNLRAGIGILIDNDFRNNDFATISLEMIKEYAFSFLKLRQLYAYILKGNEPSIRIFDKSGFNKSGTLKSWIYGNGAFSDVYIYQYLNESPL